MNKALYKNKDFYNKMLKFAKMNEWSLSLQISLLNRVNEGKQHKRWKGLHTVWEEAYTLINGKDFWVAPVKDRKGRTIHWLSVSEANVKQNTNKEE